MNNKRLEVKDLSFSYGDKDTIDKVSIEIREGEFVGLIGPNGSGKSTVLKNIYRALTPKSGSIRLDGEDLLKMSFKKKTKKMAVVGQDNDVPFDFLVEEIVAMGRNPHKKLFDIDNAHDKEIVNHALKHVGMESMAKRNYLYLSGGEKQRTMIARAVAQESDFFILDEPTNHLDISYQMQIFDFIKRLKTTVLSAIHDLNLAALYCDYIYVLREGKLVLHGKPEEIFTPDNIFEVYGVHSYVRKHPVTEKVSITFLPSEINNKIGG